MNESKIRLFEDRRIRSAWDEEKEEWYFSVVDVVGVLTEQPTPRGASTYWAVLKKRLAEEGANQLLTNCKQLKMTAMDGKKRFTDVADTEQLLRIIQSVPSPKAELERNPSFTVRHSRLPRKLVGSLGFRLDYSTTG